MARTAGAALGLLLLASCTTANSGERLLDVFAATSLADAFDVIAERFEETHEDVNVRLNLLSSSELATQIEQGAPADVFASADLENMERLESQGLISSPDIFATNEMTIAVQRGNPSALRGPSDLADPSLVVSLAAPGVPAGDYARSVLSSAGVEVTPASEEQDVRAVLTRVATGEADAGIVYESDVAVSSGVEGIPIPDRYNVIARYPIAVSGESDNEDLARDFVSLVLARAGREVLVDHGFGVP